MYFEINPKPSNGNCSIDPLSGTTNTLFYVICSNWYNEDNIKDYSLYSMKKYFIKNFKIILFYLAWITDPLKLQIIAFSPVPTFQVRLPAGNNQTSLVNLVMHIRDTLDCIAEYPMPSINVLSDSTFTLDLIKNFKLSNEINDNPIIQLLASGNQNTVGQVVTSFSQEFNQMNNENIQTAVSSKDFILLLIKTICIYL